MDDVRPRILGGILVVASSLALLASASAPKAPPPPPYDPKFTYATKNAAQPGSSGLTMAVVAPEWAKDVDKELLKTARVRKFQTALLSSINELLTAKGLKVRGPFDEAGDMTFADKRDSALALVPKFEMISRVELVLKSAKPGTKYTSAAYTYDFVYGVEGALNLRISEPQSGEFLWQKRLDLGNKAIIKGTIVTTETLAGASAGGIDAALTNNTGLSNEFMKGLEAYYAQAMENVDKYVSPEEMQVLQKQATELKGKKVY